MRGVSAVCNDALVDTLADFLLLAFPLFKQQVFVLLHRGFTVVVSSIDTA